MADLLYSGGPCSGRHVHVDDAALADGRITCGGMNYRAYDLGEGEWLALPPSHKPPQDTVTATTKAGPAWAGLVHTLVQSGPAQLRAAQAERRALLRMLRR